MSTHDSIRNMLPLCAAGALNQQEQLQVEAHTRIVCSTMAVEHVPAPPSVAVKMGSLST